ncbi:cyclic beta 1-2 glucan synthetase [Clostridium sp. 19966]|uniref:GH36-type glycosyl hydrolase domain-containing protein n=1 Tax=Clostridium sp. 19966 TaxID=2768166 RepID=UPI0028DF7692|nr:glucoamylase family protein [Clostridium sp. 19966]MDT8718698.1 cyclic beta 1-2 glucan synthetase [Clostridium sp. 19966]
MYLYILLLVSIAFVSIYIIWIRREEENQNIMEDIPSIYVNKDDMEKHALKISTYYSETKKTAYRRKLIKSLDESYKKIIEGHDYIDKEIDEKYDMVPAAEWLLDNLYLIQKEYKDIKSSMPSSYYRNLPTISKGMMKGYPRVYHIAIELVCHTDGLIDENVIEAFIGAYQKNTILSSGELWALPIMIRIALIQNISQIVNKIVYAIEEKKRGEQFGENIINAYTEKKLDFNLESLKKKSISFSSHFVESLIKVLRDNGVDNENIYAWINENLESNQKNLDMVISGEHQKQAGFQLSLGNSITSIRNVTSLNWKDTFERLNYAEAILRADPSGVYANMDFESRDYYRHKLEMLARKFGVGEAYVAKKVLECAKEGIKDYEKHIGYYIIDNGVYKLQNKIKSKVGLFKVFNNLEGKISVRLYATIICLGIVFFEVLILALGVNEDSNPIAWKYILGAVLLLVPASEIVISIFNWSISQLFSPRFVPKLSMEEGIPEESRSIVVVPALTGDEKKIRDIINDLEIYYLANHEKNLYFTLLMDFPDSDKEKEEKDELLIKSGLQGIKELNDKFALEGTDIFYFLSRRRIYNDKEKKWMGWERKRGKLMEFNSFLRGNKNTSYDVISGNIEELGNIKYVITLDADTQLPRDSAKKLIGAMSHILNVPYIHENSRAVTRGYGIMQPRVNVGSISANKTMFSRIFSGETGIDIYTTAVSDTYQDIFAEGIFTGKGIYDVDTFETVLKNSIPENLVLSHDLLEGSFGRTALVSDIELVDGYPAYYHSYCRRLHRWVRGDWQLIPWLIKKSALNKLSRWKIFDNLRRSLLMPAIMLLLIYAITIIDVRGPWVVATFLSVICPILFDVSEAVVTPTKGISLTGKIKNVGMVIDQVFLLFCFIPYEAYLMIDAIVRTLYRMIFSKMKLLEWQTSAEAEARSLKSFGSYIKSMWSGSLIALVLEILAFNKGYAIGISILPACIIWFLSPSIAYYISQDIIEEKQETDEQGTKLLRRISRKTWAYFEDFVNSENNWLGPDNFQQEPPNGLAKRTSPTNIGMAITSNLNAYNLGYISFNEMSDRIDKTLASSESLTKFKGHLYNWYDTVSKQPLYPRYVSTVDSGNLVAYMWLAYSSIDKHSKMPLMRREFIRGIEDTALLAEEEFEDNVTYENLIEEVKRSDLDIISWKEFLMKLWSTLLNYEKSNKGKSLYWNGKLKTCCSKFLGDIQRFFPWADKASSLNKQYDYLKNQLKDIPFSSPLNEVAYSLRKVAANLKEGIAEKSEDIKEIILLIENGCIEIEKEIIKNRNLSLRLNKFVSNTDFKVVYDRKKHLFSIGYDIEKDALNNSYYDLLASEARCASFMAIAKGDVDQKHWFKLNRSMMKVGKRKGLISWSGTMFEYFMPALIMKNYPNTLLDETYTTVVEAQKRYCSNQNVPWGISESAFYHFDNAMNYQYKAFGVPGVGLKRGLSGELVVAPYATVLALSTDLKGSIKNLRKLIEIGMEGRYGLYEAVDFTKERLTKGKNKLIVKSFMIHHEGMSLMAMDNVLNDNILIESFHSIPMVKATELLLQEKVSKNITYDKEKKHEVHDARENKHSMVVRSYDTALTTTPETHLLANGSYSMMISNSGSGYAKRNDITLYRWREDVTRDCSGMFFYVKNQMNNDYYSVTYEPCNKAPEDYNAVFSMDKAEFKRKDGNISTHMEVTVSNEEDAEIRRITLTNHGEECILEVTSYLEVILATYNSDIVHPAFSNLFVETEYVEDIGCIVASRRPRAKKQQRPWMMQVMSYEGEAVGGIQYETNRLNFIGRGRSISNPLALEKVNLKNTVGAVLDPIISIRRSFRLKPGGSVKIAYTTATANSRAEVIEMAKKYKEFQNTTRVFELAWTKSILEMKYMGIRSTQVNLYQLMASKIIYINTQLHSRQESIKNINKHQSDLWAYGISGDLPIVSLIIRYERDIDVVRQMLKAHEYWAIKGLTVDFVIINLEEPGYSQPLHSTVRDMINMRRNQASAARIFLYNRSTIDKDIADFIMAISRLVIDADKGSIMSQIRTKNEEALNFIKVEEEEKSAAGKDAVNFIRSRSGEQSTIQIMGSKIKNAAEKIGKMTWKNSGRFSTEFSEEITEISRRILKEKFKPEDLYYYNGYGGFSKEDNSYIILLDGEKNTPAPWINVISNEEFGFNVSESGSAYTWNKNSRENKLTTWSNDPVTDLGGEFLFIRDEEDGKYWSITRNPVRDNGMYVINHGFGYSSFMHEVNGIEGSEIMFAPRHDSCKICIVTLKNKGEKSRKLSLTYYCDIVLGVVPQQTAQYIYTEIEKDKNYIYAQNSYSQNFGKLKAFLSINGGYEESFTGSRTDFIGRGNDYDTPAAMMQEKLSSFSGAGMEPCLAENVKISLEPGEEKNLIIILGQYESQKEIENSIKKYGSYIYSFNELNNVKKYWQDILGKIKVSTPDKSMDILLNGWLMYQTISCRYWSRTAFYQSGGAYGYRDQLQDSMSIGILDSNFTREQILRSASRQYLEGDVQHWWHPIVDSGIRTRFSDDLLWLPYVTADYILRTGDYGILDESVNYLEDEPLKEDEDERYNISRKSSVEGSIYEHCLKAIEKALKFGTHNIPLMGSGDWNDGMSTVGNKGSGESVWLGWFLYDILNKFKEICKYKKDDMNYHHFCEMADFIRENLESNAWDGAWYRRAYFDDGTPLGSIQNDECQIDSLAQSWAVISGAGNRERCKKAIESVEKHLVKEDAGTILLLTPAFDNSSLEPGYIKGYVPGVRENGAQYTHAAIWFILAEAMIKNGDKAYKFFNMINPINHSETQLECETYKVEPYVMSADVYMREPYTGRGGWSWYTGAAGWMYRVGIEAILGLKVMGDKGFVVEPQIPFYWDEYSIKYENGNCIYNIKVKRNEEKSVALDGKFIPNGVIPILESGYHNVDIKI